MDPVSSREVFDLLVRVFEESADPEDKVCVALTATLTEVVNTEHAHADAQEARSVYERMRGGAVDAGLGNLMGPFSGEAN